MVFSSFCELELSITVRFRFGRNQGDVHPSDFQRGIVIDLCRSRHLRDAELNEALSQSYCCVIRIE